MGHALNHRRHRGKVPIDHQRGARNLSDFFTVTHRCGERHLNFRAREVFERGKTRIDGSSALCRQLCQHLGNKVNHRRRHGRVANRRRGRHLNFFFRAREVFKRGGACVAGFVAEITSRSQGCCMLISWRILVDKVHTLEGHMLIWLIREVNQLIREVNQPALADSQCDDALEAFR